jgi:hypothetical protein
MANNLNLLIPRNQGVLSTYRAKRGATVANPRRPCSSRSSSDQSESARHSPWMLRHAVNRIPPAMHVCGAVNHRIHLAMKLADVAFGRKQKPGLMPGVFSGSKPRNSFTWPRTSRPSVKGDPWEEVIGQWVYNRSSVSISEVLEQCLRKPQAR